MLCITEFICECWVIFSFYFDLVGAPLMFERKDCPSEEDINELHEKFCANLVCLFESHKAKYIDDSDKVHLNII